VPDLVLLTQDPLDFAWLRESLSGDKLGAIVEFNGVVRRTEDGLSLRGIDYEVYVPMAEKALEELLGEAHARWGEFSAVIAHRSGVVEVGESAVYIGVATGHRQEAFELCRWLIDELKAQVPIWKQRHLPLLPQREA